MLSSLVELINKLVPDRKVALRQRYLGWLPGFVKRREERRAATKEPESKKLPPER